MALHIAQFLLNHPIALELARINEKVEKFIVDYNAEKGCENDEKIGMDTGIKLTNPLDGGKLIPLYIANYVLMDYGTGAIFACPAHDQRDYEFAKKYKLPMIPVMCSETIYELDLSEKAYTNADQCLMINSEKFDGLTVNEARKRVITELVESGVATKKANYKIRDWGVSRQRYWGCPIPIIFCKNVVLFLLQRVIYL